MAGLVIKFSLRERAVFWISCLVIIINLVVLQCSFFFSEYSHFFVNRLESVLHSDIHRIGIYYWELSGHREQEEEFFRLLLQDDRIQVVSNLLAGSTDFNLELAEVQSSLSIQDPEKKYFPDSDIVGRYMTVSMLSALQISLQEGALPDEKEIMENEKNSVHLILLGSEFAGKYHSGDLIPSQNGKEFLRVAGVLQKGSVSLEQGICRGESGEYYMNGDPMVNLDGSVVFLSLFPISTPGLVITSEGYTIEDIQDSVDTLCKKYSVDFSIISISDHMNEVKQYNPPIRRLFSVLIVVITLFSIVALTVFQIVNLNRNTYDYGVLIINGSGTTELLKMMLFSILSRFVLSFVFSCGLSLFVLKMLVGNDKNGSIIRNVLLRYSYGYSFVIGLLIMIAASVYPLVRLVKMDENRFVSGQFE